MNLIIRGKVFLFLFIILIISSCSDDNMEDVVIVNYMSLTIDNEEYEAINENVGGNENCGNLYVSTGYHDGNGRRFNLSIGVSKTGQLLSVWYDEYESPGTSEPLKIFLAPNFNPLETFNILDFNYDEDSRDLSFSFNGTLYFEQNNNITRELNGSIDVKSLATIDCSVAKVGLSYFSEDLNLYSNRNSMTEYANDNQLHRFISNNGYILYIHVDQDFWDITVGNIVFNENSLNNKVSLIQQQGEIVANQIPNINDHTWLEYDTSGELIIDSKIIENGHKKITGRINLQISENGNLIQIMNGIEFSTRSFY